jgi:GNAT superfamily N-acetyltransferase
MFKIRPFQPTDAEYQAIHLVEKAVYPENAESAADVKHNDAIRKPEQFYRRWVVEEDGRLIAFGNASRLTDSPEPDRYHFTIVVHPNFEQNGVGTAVYDQIWQTLQNCDPKPTILETGCYQHHTQSVHFIQKRGFQQVMRWVISKLDVPAFDPSLFAPLRRKLGAEGIAFYAVPQLQTNNPEWLPELHELDWQLVQDEPLPYTPKKMSLERFKQLYLDAPNAMVESWVVAVENGRFIGNSMLEKRSQPGTASTGFTGILRDYRRRGLATALKAQSIAYAQAAGYQGIRTGNEENNPMLALNKKLGFVEITARLAFEKRLENGSLL